MNKLYKFGTIESRWLSVPNGQAHESLPFLFDISQEMKLRLLLSVRILYSGTVVVGKLQTE